MMRQETAYKISSGNPERMGATVRGSGVNFAVRIPEGREASLVLLDAKGKETVAELPFDKSEKIGEVGSVFVHGLKAGKFTYYYRIGGEKVLDPCARGLKGEVCYVPAVPESWEAETSPKLPLSELSIYRLHVRGFSMNAPKGGSARGTFAGTAANISYIRALGFTAVELMPVYEWDDTLRVQPYARLDTDETGKAAGELPHNFWGYSEKNMYFAPNRRFAHTDDPCAELRKLVHEIHACGMLCIMEIYFPEGQDPYTALLAVRHWKVNYHMDGFHLIGGGVPVSSLIHDPLLTDTKLMFEWVDPSWSRGRTGAARNLIAYNDGFLRTGRAFLKGDEGQSAEFASKIRSNPAAFGVVNYMAGTNGFTLYDSVSYDWKHNEENGEDNRDGCSENFSWNCGAEGPTKKPAVLNLRMRQLKNACVYTFLSQGIPMLLAGDESGNTQEGNNNAYSSDDPIGWVDFARGKRNKELAAFVKGILAFRKAHPILHMDTELKGSDYRSFGMPDISFHDTKAWYGSFDRQARSLAVLYNGKYGDPDDGAVYAAYNAGWESHEFALPQLENGQVWHLAVDTAAKAGAEFPPMGERSITGSQKLYIVPPRSCAVFVSGPAPEEEEKA